MTVKPCFEGFLGEANVHLGWQIQSSDLTLVNDGSRLTVSIEWTFPFDPTVARVGFRCQGCGDFGVVRFYDGCDVLGAAVAHHYSSSNTAKIYTNGSRNCPLYLQKKYEILFYKNKGELLNKRSELIAKCRHSNKFLLANYKSRNRQRFF